ncbi:DUF4398 domain-containing protein [Persicimonas caeni]|uniref:DUF4398 domain-containing protein n=1 Tax=Persicimonas caeni TaxID=2292766 RepID=A0A4Y6PTW9_PERCE|nr:DUF4398 domain-containing protein [Persicimonas caeni]QDG51748.1 DUF4398 domain-containing protein [Persicimonas caeni]QED32969.1 DUF4398 domain-containing protein [Persicimonas caeni]
MQVLRDTVRTLGTTARGGLVAATLVLVTVLLVGCGPVQSTQRISEAEVDFERARVVEAHEKAPYEYFSAKYYLHKAKEEWGYSDFEAAYDYARKAKQAARAAILKAKEDPWTGSPVDKAKTQEVEGAQKKQAESDTEAGPRGF